MCLTYPVLGKLVRESLVTPGPIPLDGAGVAALKTQLEAWFARVDDLDMCWRDAKQDASVSRGLARHLCEIDPKFLHRDSFNDGAIGLGLDGKRNLCLGYQTYEPAHLVGSMDELFAFLDLCRERVARWKGQQARRSKVRQLRRAAVLARVQRLARTFHCDYHADTGPEVFRLALRFEDKHVVEVLVPVATPEKVLPGLEALLPHLSGLWGATIPATVRLNASGGALYGPWISHQSLGQE